MLKRTMVIVILCFSMTVLLQAQAMAWNFPCCGGGGYNSYYFTFTIAGGQKPGTITTFVATNAVVKKASLVCFNPGTNQKDVREGKGGITTIDLISNLGDQNEVYDHRGKFILTTDLVCSRVNETNCICSDTDPSLNLPCNQENFNLFWNVGVPDCRNANWTPLEYLIQQFNLNGTVYTDCELNLGGSPKLPLETFCTNKAQGNFWCETKQDPRTWPDPTPEANVVYRCAAVGAPIAWDDYYSVRKNKTLTVNAPGVLGNDTDAEGNSILVAAVNGDTPLVGTPILIANGTVTLIANGNFTFTPSNGFVGTTSFKYNAKDNLGNTGPDATVTINVY